MSSFNGAAIGVLAASAMGSILTQTMLDTFHHAGIGDELISNGMARIEEIFNNSSTLNKIIFTVDRPINQLINLPFTTIKQICIGSPFLIQFKQCEWIESWEKEFGKLSTPNENCLIYCVNIDATKMIEFNVEIEIFKKMETLKPIAISPLMIEKDNFIYQLLFQIDFLPQHVIEVSTHVLPLDTQFDKMILYLSNKYWEPMIQNLYLYGIKKIEKVIEFNNTSLIIGKPSASLYDVVFIDPINIICNKTTEMYQIFGIEVAKRCIIEELKKIMPQILPCHIQVVVDKMTWSGLITSVTRYTARSDPDPLKRISFEEASRNINTACVDGEIDNLSSISSKLVASKKF
jgi:hypothetical protein